MCKAGQLKLQVRYTVADLFQNKRNATWALEVVACSRVFSVSVAVGGWRHSVAQSEARPPTCL